MEQNNDFRRCNSIGGEIIEGACRVDERLLKMADSGCSDFDGILKDDDCRIPLSNLDNPKIGEVARRVNLIKPFIEKHKKQAEMIKEEKEREMQELRETYPAADEILIEMAVDTGEEVPSLISSKRHFEQMGGSFNKGNFMAFRRAANLVFKSSHFPGLSEEDYENINLLENQLKAAGIDINLREEINMLTRTTERLPRFKYIDTSKPLDIKYLVNKSVELQRKPYLNPQEKELLLEITSALKERKKIAESLGD